jgi:hypothetical protein
MLKTRIVRLPVTHRPLIASNEQLARHVTTKAPKYSFNLRSASSARPKNSCSRLLGSISNIRFNSTASKPNMTDATNHPLSGLWQPTQLQKLHYGPDSVKQHLLNCLPKDTSKAFIITGNSLATKTPLVKQVEQLLGNKYAGTFSKIGEHAPVAQLDEATALVTDGDGVDTVISIGGGSPIDSSKAVPHCDSNDAERERMYDDGRVHGERWREDWR